MGRNYQVPYDEYEDELDRMRARRRKAAPVSQSRRDKGGAPGWNNDFDDDFAIEDLDSDDESYFDDGFDDDLDDDFDDSQNYPGRAGNQKNRRRTGSGSSSHQTGGYSVRQQASSHRSGSYSVRQQTGYSSNNRKKAAKRKKKGPFILLFILGFLVLFSGVLYAKRWMKDRDGYWNIAVFGVDSRDGGLEKGALADVQMLASINKKTGEIRLVSVYRDTYVQINEDGDFHKINEAYFKGGHKQALETLKRNLDVDVDDYATFNWKAVADAINILGGVDLEITESEFAYINSFITATVESTGIGSFHLEHAGLNHLDGVQAVAYSRLRLMDTDYNRTERQRKVVSLALEKAKQADFNTLSALAGVVLSEISTSVGLEDVIPLAKDVNHYYLGQTGGFPFAKTTAMVEKLDCVIPMTLESNVIFLHQFLFDRENYQPSASVKKISGIISERTGIYEEGKSSGADKDLSGTIGNPGKDSAGGSSSNEAGNSSDKENTKAPSAQEALPSEESAEQTAEDAEKESTQQETQEETKEDKEEGKEEKEETEAINETKEDKTKESSSPEVVEPLAPEETTPSPEQIQEGPGAVPTPQEPKEDNPVSSVKPVAPPAPEIGPGYVEIDN